MRAGPRAAAGRWEPQAHPQLRQGLGIGIGQHLRLQAAQPPGLLRSGSQADRRRMIGWRCNHWCRRSREQADHRISTSPEHCRFAVVLITAVVPTAGVTTAGITTKGLSMFPINAALNEAKLPAPSTQCRCCCGWRLQCCRRRSAVRWGEAFGVTGRRYPAVDRPGGVADRQTP